MNTINIIGRLTSAAIPRGQGDNIAAAFRVAVPRPYKDANGNQAADFIDCVAFGKRAEFVLHHFAKGDRLGVSGSLRVEDYVAADGSKRRSYEIVAENIDFADGKQPQPQQPQQPMHVAQQLSPCEYPFG